MKLTEAQTREKIHKQIYEYSEIEREAERMAQFTTPGGFFHRLFTWVARGCARERAILRSERGNEDTT